MVAVVLPSGAITLGFADSSILPTPLSAAGEVESDETRRMQVAIRVFTRITIRILRQGWLAVNSLACHGLFYM